MPKLGINIDHVATLRQARRGPEPDPLLAARLCEQAGANSIVAHLREDRRHIQDEDVKCLRRGVKTRFNLEMSLSKEIVDIALSIRPDQATFVPERREEITTEGGLDVRMHFDRIKRTVKILSKENIATSLFVDPVKSQIEKSAETGAKIIEIHTGRYAEAKTKSSQEYELKTIEEMTRYARGLGLTVNAGHGLNYINVKSIAAISGIEELNIGHSVVSRALFVGFEAAVKEMIDLCRIKPKRKK